MVPLRSRFGSSFFSGCQYKKLVLELALMSYTHAPHAWLYSTKWRMEKMNHTTSQSLPRLWCKFNTHLPMRKFKHYWDQCMSTSLQCTVSIKQPGWIFKAGSAQLPSFLAWYRNRQKKGIDGGWLVWDWGWSPIPSNPSSPPIPFF